MKDENIKEILDSVKLEINSTKSWIEPVGLNRDAWNKLLDYITNLQEQLHKASLDIQELTERDLMCPTSCDKLTNLQEENERLKAENQGLVVKQNALAYYLVKQGLSFEDIVKIINDFKNE